MSHENNVAEVEVIEAEVMEDEAVKLMIIEAKDKVDVIIQQIEPVAEQFGLILKGANEWADALMVESQGDIDSSAEGIRAIKGNSKAVEKVRQFFLGEHKNFTGKVDGMFNPIKKGFDDLEKGSITR